MGGSLPYGLVDRAAESPSRSHDGRGRKGWLLVRSLHPFWLRVAVLSVLAAGVTVLWLQPASDAVREMRLCRRVALLEAGPGWESAWAKRLRRSERVLTAGEAIRLLYPHFVPERAPGLRYRPPPAPHNIAAIQAATSRSLREIALVLRNGRGERRTVSCRFIRLDGRTQWLDPADRSQLLFAAALGRFGTGAEGCCIPQDEAVR